MGAFDDCLSIEKAGRDVLIPFLKDTPGVTKVEDIPGGRANIGIQKLRGDIVVYRGNKRSFTAEIKCERRNKTGNFYLETWSNRVFDPEYRNIGWMYTSGADQIFYYFIAERELYTMVFQQLWHWAFVEHRMFQFEEKPQKAHTQQNATWGYCVPITVLCEEITVHRYELPEPVATCAA